MDIFKLRPHSRFYPWYCLAIRGHLYSLRLLLFNSFAFAAEGRNVRQTDSFFAFREYFLDIESELACDIMVTTRSHSRQMARIRRKDGTD